MKREIVKSALDFINDTASEVLNDKNRLEKAIAVHIRNGIEDFHWKYLSDDNMREINPRIRNAIYTFLVFYEKENNSLPNCNNIEICMDYISNNTYGFLLDIGVNMELICEFDESIFVRLYESLYDISIGGNLMAELDILRVPKYWEDCLYIDSLTNN